MKYLVATFFTFFSSVAFATDCSVTIQDLQPYKGVVGEVTSVRSTETTDFAVLGLTKMAGTRYDFQYRYPNGYVGWTWTFSHHGDGGDWTVEEGDRYFWSPANSIVRAKHIEDDRHVPIIMKEDCSFIQVDWSGPAKDIAGI